jgi:DNA repair protein RadC
MLTKTQYEDKFFTSLNTLTGISITKLRAYAKENNPFNILEHPMVLEPDDRQLNKIGKLNEFLSSYHILRLNEENNKISLKSSQEAGAYFQSLLNGVKDRERVLVGFLDNSHSIIELKTVAEGSVSMSVVYPREILKMAMANDCNAIIIAHNHPGGSVTPSKPDVDLTQQIVNIFEPLNIAVADHIIVGGSKYSSMAENGYLPRKAEGKANYQPIKLGNDPSIIKNSWER